MWAQDCNESKPTISRGIKCWCPKPSSCLLRQGHRPKSGLSPGIADGPDFLLRQPNHACPQPCWSCSTGVLGSRCETYSSPPVPPACQSRPPACYQSESKRLCKKEHSSDAPNSNCLVVDRTVRGPIKTKTQENAVN